MEIVLNELLHEVRNRGCCPPNFLTLTLHHVSAKYGVDTNNDGIFDTLFADSGEGPAGIIAAADGSIYGSGERRLALVFNLSQITLDAGINSAALNLAFNSNQGGGSYELHGFSSKQSVDLDALIISNQLAGPFLNFLPFPIDVSAFIQSLLASRSVFAGFSVRDTSGGGGIAYDGRGVQIRPDRTPSLEITFTHRC